MLVVRSRIHRQHTRLKTSLSSQAPHHHSLLPWSSSIQTVLPVFLCIVSWIGKETLLTPAKIHRLEIQLVKCMFYYDLTGPVFQLGWDEFPKTECRTPKGRHMVTLKMTYVAGLTY